MPTTRLRQALPAPPGEVWALLADPYHQPRWWPRVQRVERVEAGGFTQVLGTAKGKGVRADFAIVRREPETLLEWSQQLEDSPFERLMAEAVTTFALAPAADGGTSVTVELRQRLRGWSRLTPFLFKGAAKRQLREALDGLRTLLA